MKFLRRRLSRLRNNTGCNSSRTQDRDHIFRLRAKFHLHSTQCLFCDAAERAAPPGVDRRNGANFCVGEQYRDAIRGLHDQYRTSRSPRYRGRRPGAPARLVWLGRVDR